MGGPPMGAAPAAGGNKTMRYVGIGCGVLLLLSCMCGIGWQACAYMAAQGLAAGAAAAPVAGGGGGGSVCQRAADCCNAYVQALGPAGASAASACQAMTIPGVPDASCEQSIATYRQSLQAMGQAVPASCQ
jgi:hypothetical protein